MFGTILAIEMATKKYMENQHINKQKNGVWQPLYSEDGTPSYNAIEPIPSQHEAGAKLDDGKADASLLEQFPRALMEVAWVGTYGKTKYTRGGWQSVKDAINRYTAAMMRHWFTWSKGQVYDTDPWMDTDEGRPFKVTVRHDAQVAWNALAVLELRLREEEKKNGTV